MFSATTRRRVRFCPVCLSSQRVHLQPSFDENRSAFFQVLAGDLRCSSPERDIDKGDFLALFAAVGRVSPIHGDAEIADGAALWACNALRDHA